MPDGPSARSARPGVPAGLALVRRLERHPVLVFCLGGFLVVGILMGIPFLYLRSGTGKAPARTELVELSGRLRSLETRGSLGLGSTSALHLRIEEDVRTFRIDRTGRDLLGSTESLVPGAEVAFLIRKSESDRSLGQPGMLDLLLDWRRIPTVYELRAGREVLLTREAYDESVEASHRKALRLGVLGIVLVSGTLLVLHRSRRNAFRETHRRISRPSVPN